MAGMGAVPSVAYFAALHMGLAGTCGAARPPPPRERPRGRRRHSCGGRVAQETRLVDLSRICLCLPRLFTPMMALHVTEPRLALLALGLLLSVPIVSIVDTRLIDFLGLSPLGLSPELGAS
jgi:hypothetical protein